jgi:hypothetical protein
MKLTPRGYFIAGVIVGAIASLTILFFSTHHVVIDSKTCHNSDMGVACSYHYERN